MKVIDKSKGPFKCKDFTSSSIYKIVDSEGTIIHNYSNKRNYYCQYRGLIIAMIDSKGYLHIYSRIKSSNGAKTILKRFVGITYKQCLKLIKENYKFIIEEK